MIKITEDFYINEANISTVEFDNAIDRAVICEGDYTYHITGELKVNSLRAAIELRYNQ